MSSLLLPNTKLAEKTAFKGVRVATLGSRRSLCINPDINKLTESRIDDACLDLQQSSNIAVASNNILGNTGYRNSTEGLEKTSHVDRGIIFKKGDFEPEPAEIERQKRQRSQGCPFRSVESDRRLAEKVLAKIMDVEELMTEARAGMIDIDVKNYDEANDQSVINNSQGLRKGANRRGSGGCAYYASRKAAQLAELIVLPYTSILHAPTRKRFVIFPLECNYNSNNNN